MDPKSIALIAALTTRADNSNRQLSVQEARVVQETPDTLLRLKLISTDTYNQLQTNGNTN